MICLFLLIAILVMWNAVQLNYNDNYKQSAVAMSNIHSLEPNEYQVTTKWFSCVFRSRFHHCVVEIGNSAKFMARIFCLFI